VRQFSIIYNVKGTRIVDVFLPDNIELPENWGSLKTEEQDEWLYEHQQESKTLWSDEYKGEAVNVLPVAQLKAVI
jgi:hypothetical protein